MGNETEGHHLKIEESNQRKGKREELELKRKNMNQELNLEVKECVDKKMNNHIVEEMKSPGPVRISRQEEPEFFS